MTTRPNALTEERTPPWTPHPLGGEYVTTEPSSRTGRGSYVTTAQRAAADPPGTYVSGLTISHHPSGIGQYTTAAAITSAARPSPPVTDHGASAPTLQRNA